MGWQLKKQTIKILLISLLCFWIGMELAAFTWDKKVKSVYSTSYEEGYEFGYEREKNNP